MILIHGTTRYRAELILKNGPDPYYKEGGGLPGTTGDFSMYVEHGPYIYRAPEEYAIGKANNFPNKGRAAILAVDVPNSVILFAVDELYPLEFGLIQFNNGFGLEELQSMWPELTKEIRSLS